MYPDVSRSCTLSELQTHLGGEIKGDGSTRVTHVASLAEADSDSVSFANSEKYLEVARVSRAGVLFVSATLAEQLDRNLLVCANPHASFARAVALFHPAPEIAPGIHPGAIIEPDAIIDASASVGAQCVIGARTRIGARSVIGAGCVIGDDVEIGAGSRLYPRVTIYPGSRVGARAILHSGVVIGADGFGLAWEGDHWLKVPQVGRVILGDDVEVGANTTIDRGALDDTVIGDGVKLDNLIQIGHNCRIGANTAVAACAAIAGSARIGRGCQIGGAAMIAGHLEIADGVIVSGGTLIAKSITKAGVYTSSLLQMPHSEWLRNSAQLRHLAEMRDRIRQLEKKLEDKEA